MDDTGRLDHLRRDTAAVAATISTDALGAPVPGCPGWDLQTMVGHLGFVHRWAAAAVAAAAAPDLGDIDAPPTDAAALADWLLLGGEHLAAVLSSVDPAAPTWHVFPAPMVAGVWIRRQAQETSVHRWDAQSAVGEPESIDPGMAADGVGEYFEVILPRKLARDGGGPPAGAGVLHVAATDTPAQWWVQVVDDRIEVRDTLPSGRVAAGVTGRAEDLLLALFARRSPGSLACDGDVSLASSWLSVGGN